MLSSAVWGGISGLTAVITLAIMLYDRKKRGSNDIMHTFFRMWGFFVLGALYAPLIMSVANLVADGLDMLGVGPLRGDAGEMLYRLGKLHLGPWRFNPHLNILQIQLGAMGLWVGGLFAGFFAVIFGYSISYDFRKLDKYWLIWPFFSVMFTIFVGIVNVVINS
ncbi:MAG: hypothetical protein QOG84_2288 [Sphingomonadales bacterium]|jgi:hypothetical protein|nr:hypothetical protein [Sphingomonadales bacterium]